MNLHLVYIKTKVKDFTAPYRGFSNLPGLVQHKQVEVLPSLPAQIVARSKVPLHPGQSCLYNVEQAYIRGQTHSESKDLRNSERLNKHKPLCYFGSHFRSHKLLKRREMQLLIIKTKES